MSHSEKNQRSEEILSFHLSKEKNMIICIGTKINMISVKRSTSNHQTMSTKYERLSLKVQYIIINLKIYQIVNTKENNSLGKILMMSLQFQQNLTTANK